MTDDEFFAYMARRDLAILERVEQNRYPLLVSGDDTEYQHLKIMGYLDRMRSQPRCGQDDDPPFYYMLTARGRDRIRELRAQLAPSTVASGDGRE